MKPISVNKLYVNLKGQSRRFMSTEGKKQKAFIEDCVKEQVNKNNLLEYLSSLVGKRLTVEIKITSVSWLLKDGITTRRTDIQNKEKLISDSVFSAFNSLGIPLDDSQMWILTMIKVCGIEEKAEVSISECMS